MLVNLEIEAAGLEPCQRSRLNSASSTMSNRASKRRKPDEESDEDEITWLKEIEMLEKDIVTNLEQQSKTKKYPKQVNEYFKEQLLKVKELSLKIALDNAYLRGRLSRLEVDCVGRK